MPSPRKTKKAEPAVPVRGDDLRVAMDAKEILRPAALETTKTQVTIVRRTGESVLVQYVKDGALVRCTVPAAQVTSNMLADRVLAAGIPYGFPWEDIRLTFDTRKFMNELHQVDIWTAEDILKSPQKLWSALRAALADNLSTVLEIARNETRRR